MATTQYRTPGVYVVEKNAFPNSVVEVATAVPLFIGYTEKNMQGTNNVANTPVRLSSLREFEAIYGGPARTQVTFAAPVNTHLAQLSFAQAQRYLLHSCMRLFFDNGGGACYVVSVGNYAATPRIEQGALWNETIEDALKRETEPTMIVIPESTQLADADWKSVSELVLQHCTNMMSRVTILDVPGGDKGDPNRVGSSQLILDHAAKFRQLTSDKLSYGAGYYPWLYTTIVSDSDIDFRNLDSAARNALMADVDADAIVSLSKAEDAATLDAITKATAVVGTVTATTDPLPQEHTVLLAKSPAYKKALGDTPDAALKALPPAALTALMASVKDEAQKALVPPKLKLVRDSIAAINQQDVVAPELTAALAAHTRLAGNSDAYAALFADNPAADFRSVKPAPLKAALDAAKAAAAAAVAAAPAAKKAAATQTQTDVNADAATIGGYDTDGAAREDARKLKAALTSHAVLLTASPLYKTVMAAVRPMVNLLPPSAAMAGVYTRTDHLFGVFKAPANTGLTSVAAPSLNITHAEQEDLNVPLDGKAINAIRALPGRGLMVWGARTLDGNSQDWRYVNVRRTMIMLEQSIKAAAQAYVFQPNTASTWVTVRAMIENYLTNKWKEGALMGTTPQEAFGVEVGLGSTMSGNDVLDGYMLVTIKVAIVRPAEFIELTFVQQMQTAA